MASYVLSITFDGGMTSTLGTIEAADDQSACREEAGQLKRNLYQAGVRSAVSVSLSEMGGRRVVDMPPLKFLKLAK